MSGHHILKCEDYFIQILVELKDSLTSVFDEAINLQINTILIKLLPLDSIKTLISLINDKNKVLINDFILENSILSLLLSTLGEFEHCEPKQKSPYFENKFVLKYPNNVNEEDNEAIYSNSCLKKGVGYSSGNYVKRNSNEKGEERLKQPTTNKLVFEESLRTKILYLIASLVTKLKDNYTIPQIISHSCLFTVLESRLSNESIMDISRHADAYKALLTLTQVLKESGNFEKQLKENNIRIHLLKMNDRFKAYEKIFYNKNSKDKIQIEFYDTVQELIISLCYTSQLFNQKYELPVEKEVSILLSSNDLEDFSDDDDDDDEINDYEIDEQDEDFNHHQNITSNVVTLSDNDDEDPDFLAAIKIATTNQTDVNNNQNNKMSVNDEDVIFISETHSKKPINNIKYDNQKRKDNDDEDDPDLMAAIAQSLACNDSWNETKKLDENYDIDYYFTKILTDLPDNVLIQASDESFGIGVSLSSFPLDAILSLLALMNEQNEILIHNFLMDNKLLILLLSTLSALTHHDHKQVLPFFEEKVITELHYDDQNSFKKRKSDHSTVNCWNKGVGFSSGSNQQEWDPKSSRDKTFTEELYSIKIINTINAVLGHFKLYTTRVYEIIACSCLFKVLEANLRNESIMDITQHSNLYKSFCELINIINQIAWFDSIFEEYKIPSMVSKMNDLFQKYQNLRKINASKAQMMQSEDKSIEELANILNNTVKQLNIKRIFEIEMTENSNPKTNKEELYVAKMKEIPQFDTYDLEEFTSLKNRKTHSGTNHQRSKRLALEVTTLSTSLPLSYSSSVYLRCDTNRLDLMKALIIGPEDTPYENGCFEFDIFFPQDFPKSPPVVDFKTTGNGTMRFNPNLYNCGKVCLSILNTWPGSPEEQWNEETSSLLQVLVSIQSLILVSEPYYNEPGHQIITANTQSTSYNNHIKLGTVRWAILDAIRRPSPSFKDVIKTHFSLKQHEILETCKKWCDENAAINTYYRELKQEFESMKPL